MSEAVFEGRTAAEHAEAAAEAVRAINHITGWAGGLAYPSDAWRVLGGLAAVAARLPQACEQVSGHLGGWQQAGCVGVDAGTRWAGDPGGAVREAQAGLAAAGEAAGLLHAALVRASAALCYASWTGPEK